MYIVCCFPCCSIHFPNPMPKNNTKVTTATLYNIKLGKQRMFLIYKIWHFALLWRAGAGLVHVFDGWKFF